MNMISITGRLTKDVDVKTTPTNINFAQIDLAVNRDYKKEDGKRPVDYVPITLWRNSAKYLSDYGRKGDLIEITGRLLTRLYEGKDGKTHKILYVTADNVSILSKNHQNQTADVSADDLAMEEIPF